MPRIDLCVVPIDAKADIDRAASLDGRSVSDWGTRTLTRVAREEIAARECECSISPFAHTRSPECEAKP